MSDTSIYNNGPLKNFVFKGSLEKFTNKQNLTNLSKLLLKKTAKIKMTYLTVLDAKIIVKNSKTTLRP